MEQPFSAYRIKPAEKPLYFGGEKADTSVYVSLLMGNIEPALQLLTGGKHVMDANMLYDLLLLKIIEDETQGLSEVMCKHPVTLHCI